MTTSKLQPDESALPSFDEDVFISYSRKDTDIARRLQDALAEKGRETWVDWTGIPPAGDWLATIKQGIDRAQVFVFVLSPNSLQSRVCILEEVRHAQQARKKIIPIVVADFNEAEHVPAEHAEVFAGLQKLNYIFLRPGQDDFAAGITKILQALDTDLEHVRQHTEILRLARIWSETGRPGSRLLRGKHLETAEIWLTGIGDKQPPASELQIEFLRESREASKKARRRLVGALVTGLVLVMAAAGMAVWMGILASAERHQKEAEQAQKEEQSIRADLKTGERWLLQAKHRELSSDSAFYAARAVGFEGFGKPASLPKGDPFPRLLTLENALTKSNQAVTKVELAKSQPFLWSSVATLQPSRNIARVAFSPDGETLASTLENTILLWDVETGEQKAVLSGHSNTTIASLAFSPDGGMLASGAGPGNLPAPVSIIRLWDVESGKQKMTFGGQPYSGHSYSVESVTFSPDGETLASASYRSLRLWDVKSGEQKAILSDDFFSVNSVAFSPDGETLASGSGPGNLGRPDNIVCLWGVKSGEQKSVLAEHSSSVKCVAFSPDGQTLASGSRDKSIRLWDVKSGKEKSVLAEHSSSVECVAFSPDGQTLASGSRDKSIRLWNVESGEQKAVLSGHSSSVRSVEFSSDGETLVSGTDDNTIHFWNVQSGEQKVTWGGHSAYVLSVVFSLNGETLASGADDGTIYLWDVHTGELKTVLNAHSSSVRSVAFSPDGETLASGATDKTICLWDMKSGEQKAILSGHFASVFSVAFSPDGKTLASGSADETICFWEVKTGKQKATLSGHSSLIYGVVFSPDGKTLASGSADTSVRLWDVKSGKQKAILSGHSSHVYCVAFSSDGKTLASGSGESLKSSNNLICLWDVKSGERKTVLSGHTSPIVSVAFSPNGNTLASGSGKSNFLGSSSDNSIRLWDAKSGEQKAILTGHSSWVNSVAFSPDGETLASGSADNSIRLWETTVVRPDLYTYIEEGWCHFDLDSEELFWNDPKTLDRSKLKGFRNVPQHSSLCILQNPALSEEERNWRLYLKAIEAENWATAKILYDRLTPANQSRPHANVVWAVTKLIPDQIDTALENGFVKLAEMRLSSAKVIAAQLPEEHRAHFAELERKIGATAP